MQSISLAIYERMLAARTMLENRLDRGDRGQTALEYIGLIILIATVIGILFTSNIVSSAQAAVTNFVTSILGGTPN